MKERKIQYSQRIRRSNIQNYFHQRRIQLLSYRERESINQQPLNSHFTQRQYASWKEMVIHGVRPSQEESYNYVSGPAINEEIAFDINITSIEAGEYYLNFLTDGAPYNYLEETVHLLGRLVSKMLRVQFKLTVNQEQLQLEVILKTLRKIHYYLMVGHDLYSNSNVPNFKNNNQTKRMLASLLEDDFGALLQKENGPLTAEVLNIAYELCCNYMVYPHYQVVKYIITKIITRDNLNEQGRLARQSRQIMMEFNEKIQELIMKFIIFLRMEESTNRKAKNIHHLQVIYQLHSFIEFNLVNIYQFVRHNDHAFDYQHANNDLYFSLNLFTQIIEKFRNSQKSLSYEAPNLLVLVKGSIMELIYNVTLEHSKGNPIERQADEFILTIEETVFKIYRFVLEESSNEGMISFKHFGPREWERTGSDRYILDMLTVLKVYLGQLEKEFPTSTK